MAGREALLRYAEREPDRVRASRAVVAAVQQGRIVKSKSCQARGCKSRRHIEAHHWSYDPKHGSSNLPAPTNVFNKL
jgi:hypothetical protein